MEIKKEHKRLHRRDAGEMTTKEWFNSKSELPTDIWAKKYQFNKETFPAFLDRVSNGNIEVYEAILNKEFIFAGRILANRGLHKEGRKVTYSNCYVLDKPEDSLESIFDTAKKLARTFSYGGGCGVDLSNLRPKGMPVNNAANETSGAVSFMDLYSLTTEIIGQAGRRGALMLSLDISHPDIADFIKIKSDLTKVQKANISVKITDEFMLAVKNNEKYNTHFDVVDTGDKFEKEIDARELFMELCKQNWNYAEPGILFWDNVKGYNLMSEDTNFEYDGVNPCAEEPLPAGGSCLLGSLILPTFVEDGVFNEERFKEAIGTGVVALNDVLDEGMPLHPLKIQRDSVKKWRQIGLGVLGIGDMLIKLGIKYGSPEAIEMSDKVGRILSSTAIKQSAILAKEHGKFPGMDIEAVLKSKFLQNNADEETIEMIKETGLRNSQLLTIAPTGSIGTMLETSTGIEPNFAFSYMRKTESLHGEDKFYKVMTKISQEYMEENNLTSEYELPDYFVTAQNLEPMGRVDMQATWQKYIDAAISSTVNLVKESTVEEVYEIYMKAWECNLKGLTVYRAGCAREGILTVDTDEVEETRVLGRGDVKDVASDTIYYPKEIITGCGKIKLFIGYSRQEEAIQDLYTVMAGSGGGCDKNITSTVIFMSQVLRLGGNVTDMRKAINGISPCASYVKRDGTSKGSSCSSGMMYAIIEFLEELDIQNIEKNIVARLDVTEETPKGTLECPECKEQLDVTGGCYNCPACGYSKCE